MKKRFGVLAFALALATPVDAQRLFGVFPGFNDEPPPPRSSQGYDDRTPTGDEEPPAIHELDPETGAVINSFAPPVPPSGGPDGLAFDGNSLWYLASSKIAAGPGPDGVLYELDPDDGSVRDSDAIADEYQPIDGLGALGGFVYLQNYETNFVHLFDPESDTIVGSIDLSVALPGVNIVGGASGIGSPDAILCTGSEGDVAPGGESESTLYEIDPSDGTLTNSFALEGIGNYGVATVGQRIYVASGIVPEIYVYSRSGTIVDFFNGTGPYSALGGDPPPVAVAPIPTASTLGLAFLTLALLAGGLLVLHRRTTSS